MTAPKGTPSFTSEQSRAIEKRIKKIVKGQTKILLNNPDWTAKEELKYTDVYPNNNIAYRMNGNSTIARADPYWLFYKNRLVSAWEVKYQQARTNACQRALIYPSIFYAMGSSMFLKNIVVVTNGPAFTRNGKEEHHISGQGGTTMMNLIGFGCKVFNANYDQNLEEKLVELFWNITKEVEEQYQDKKAA